MKKLKITLIVVSIAFIASLLCTWYLYGQNQKLNNTVRADDANIQAANSEVYVMRDAIQDFAQAELGYEYAGGVGITVAYTKVWNSELDTISQDLVPMDISSSTQN